MEVTVTCRQCGTQFTGGHTRLFCDECRRARRREYARKHYAANWEYYREYRAAHREKYREHAREYYWAHKW